MVGRETGFAKTEYVVAEVAAWGAFFHEYGQPQEECDSDFNHARVDFFICDGASVFGELTFTSSAGFARFGTIEMNYTMGSWLKLPTKKVA